MPLIALLLYLGFFAGVVSSLAFVNQKRHFSRAIPEEEKYDIQLILIDHYDSYTYNLYDVLANLCKSPPIVLSKDLDADALPSHDGIVLSPGPGRPSCPSDMGRTLDVLRQSPDTPVLGVCLGHQAMAHIYGATVDVATGGPAHGQIHEIRHNGGDDLWEDIPPRINVTRYHSLAVESLEGTPLKVTAMHDDGIIMALSHVDRPHYGVQFHPESIGTPFGPSILENFVKICDSHSKEKRGPRETSKQGTKSAQDKTKTTERETSQLNDHPLMEVRAVQLDDIDATPVEVYEALFGDSKATVWLDSSSSSSSSSSLRTGHQIKNSRYSIMAAMTGPMSRLIEYFGREHDRQGLFVTDVNGTTTQMNTTILEYLKVNLPRAEINHAYDLPFNGGYLGFLGYEVRFDTHVGGVTPSTTVEEREPTSAFLFCDQSLIYDHWENLWYLVAVSSAGNDQKEWIENTTSFLRKLELNEELHSFATHSIPASEPSGMFIPRRDRHAYERNIEECHEQIRMGESYELCLTNRFEACVDQGSSLDLYKILRNKNPAPFSAYMNISSGRSQMSLCCSSPERFLSVKQSFASNGFEVEAKPIKGTVARPDMSGKPSSDVMELDFARADELRRSEKNRAENLMIVDLLRNDLSRVCRTGSIKVTELMGIESFATVHQMVSTIRGQLDTDSDAIETLSACFPGGSMTGAPKMRTMEILHRMEEDVCRGAYSGCLGYLSLDGCMDMNIIIRSAILTPFSHGGFKVTVAAGGAITAMSTSDDEYEEMMLKTKAVKDAVRTWVTIAGTGATTTTKRSGAYQQKGVATNNRDKTQQGSLQ